MVELTGIPYQDNENVIDYIVHLVELDNISNYHPSQVDIAHWTSAKSGSLIIILFVSKRDKLKKRSKKISTVILVLMRILTMTTHHHVFT